VPPPAVLPDHERLTGPTDAPRAQRRLQFLADAGALFAAGLDGDTARRSATRIP
jgi:hypothetical protein